MGTDVIHTGDRLAGLRPEAALLLSCARTRMDAENARRIRTLLGEDIDWARLIQDACRHQVMPLLFWSLNTTCPEAVPKAVLEQLRDEVHANARRSLFLIRELLTLLHLCETHGVSAIPFKGPVLAASVYGNVALRQFLDLDILVHRRDVPRVRELLLSRGYRLRTQLTAEQEAARLKTQYECAFVSDDGFVLLELHWRMMPSYDAFHLDSQRMWERVQPLSLAGTAVRNLSAEDLLLFLCVHGTKHCWERLQWVCDVAELVRAQQQLDWQGCMAYASELGCQRMLLLGLFLAHDLLGTTLSAEILRKLQSDPAVESLAASARALLLCSHDKPAGEFRRSLFRIQAREHLRDGIRHALGYAMIPNTAEWTLVTLPVFLFPLYYVLRPLRLYLFRPLRLYAIQPIWPYVPHPIRVIGTYALTPWRMYQDYVRSGRGRL